MTAVPFIEAIGGKIEIAIGHCLASSASYSLNERSKGSEQAQLGRQESAKITAMRDLYMQKFQPHMILDYFEGSRQEGDIFFINDVEILDLSKNGKGYIFTKWDVASARILDQFITDCSRLCIDLVWKKEIVEKYFS